MSPEALETMIANCCMFGLYAVGSSHSERTQIGFARLVTDYVTLAYLTDVFVLPEYQRKGLGKWMIRCVKETMNGFPAFRAALLFTSVGERSAAPFYEKELGMEAFGTPDNGRVLMMAKGSTFVHLSES